MSNYTLEVGVGDMFTDVSRNAKELAGRQNITVQFDFNNVLCVVEVTI